MENLRSSPDAPRAIGQLAALTGVKVPTIRFYEQIGLLPEPSRTSSARRQYDADAVRRLTFIRHARQLGFPVEAIRSLLELSDHPDRSCEQANQLAAQQLAAVDEKIAQLQTLRRELHRLAHAGCLGQVAECHVLESLGEPAG
ncbi:MerR family transcriptional regulator [Caulobacter sp. DWR2-3-1b2]|uniref:MerR family transcriptional regulator n=1 Tax=unclassified Caulobacter TaxID=2648921 RepID=UPI003CF48560